MNCVIVAAGLGTRLREVSTSKPLTPLAGVPLIEHVVRRAATAGVTRFVVVTGHEAERLEQFLGKLAARLDLRIDFARVEDWTLANGYSVLAGSALVDGVYLLLMSDHLFDPEIARRLAASEHSADLILAVDSDLAGEFIDLADATKVEVAEDGGILAIGKDLTHYNAVDTGVFLAGPGLAPAIEADIAEGGPGSISAGVQRLAKAGQARTMNIGTARWIDVDDGRMLELAERLLASEGVTGNAA
ncbi:MAG: phosphocholine cytidylyltransferase family protein [Croceibacterium sp.]